MMWRSICGPSDVFSRSCTLATHFTRARMRLNSWRVSWRFVVCLRRGYLKAQHESKCFLTPMGIHAWCRTRVARPEGRGPRICRWHLEPLKQSTSTSCRVVCSGILESASRPRMLCSRSGSWRATPAMLLHSATHVALQTIMAAPPRMECPRRHPPRPGTDEEGWDRACIEALLTTVGVEPAAVVAPTRETTHSCSRQLRPAVEAYHTRHPQREAVRCIRRNRWGREMEQALLE
mmetsp:Transcript_15893/g.40455  ORF Transcript_15893/g.40455 Transcript_15893/m.40455 type:complete len:234 (-) Transcript_15893:177-878(-)